MSAQFQIDRACALLGLKDSRENPHQVIGCLAQMLSDEIKRGQKYKCRACNTIQGIAHTRPSKYVSSTVRVCGDACCGGTCDEFPG
jgi:hypothetical protein